MASEPLFVELETDPMRDCPITTSGGEQNGRRFGVRCGTQAGNVEVPETAVGEIKLPMLLKNIDYE